MTRTQAFTFVLSLATGLGAQADPKPEVSAKPPGLEWPQFRGPNRDGVWREQGLMTRFPDKLKLRWSRPIGGGYSGPTVADGRVYVTDRVDQEAELERVHCLAWDTGKKLWSHSYACQYRISYKAGPRCSVLVADGRAYSLGAMGHLFCFDAKDGKVLWSKNLDKEYRIRMPIWGIAASPILEGGLLIVPVSGKDAYLVAFDPKTGEEKWKAFSDRGNYSAPIVVEQANKRVLVCWSGDRILGADPATGELHWSVPFKAKNMPLGVASPILYKDKLFLTGFYDGCILLQLLPNKLEVKKLWRRRGRNERATDGLHSTISTPLIRGDHVYGVDSYGEFRCLKLADGERIWEDTTAVPRSRWATIHFVQNGNTTWMFNERGELILGNLTPEGFREIDRVGLIEPTRGQLNQRGGVCWTHPAFAYRHVFVRNDKEIVCADLSAKTK